MSKTVVLRGPKTAQKLRGSKTAFDILLMRGNPNYNQFNRGPLFATPEPEPPAPEPKPDPVEERIVKLEATFNAKLNDAFKTIRKLSEPKEPKEPDEPKTTKEELAALKAEIRAEKEEIAANARQSAVEEAFRKLGCTEEDSIARADSFLKRNADSIMYDAKNRSVLFKGDAVSDPMKLSEWFSAQDAAGRFKGIKPAKEAPRKEVKGSTMAQSDGTKMTFKEFQAAQRSGQKLDLTKIQIVDE